MKLSHTLFTASAVALMVTLAACSSDDDASSGAASSCASAKKVSDDCNAKPAEGGVSVTTDFDQSKCESAGDQGKKVADCIAANPQNCDCVLKCALAGSCS